MPELTGAWAPSSSRNQRMRLRLSYSVSLSATQATVRADLYVDAGYSFNDRSNSLAWSGTFGSGSTSASVNVSTNGSQKLRSFSRTVNLGPSPQQLPFSASLSGIEYVGSTARVSGSLSVPARRVSQPPATPSSTRAIRRSDTQHEVGWAPVSGATSYRVLRRDLRQPNWVTIARPSGSASAIIDRGTVPNRRYRWAVRAVNSAGESDSALTRFLRTSPAPAVNVRITGRSSAGIELTWTVRAAFGDSQVVQAQSRTTGGAWSEWGHIPGLDSLGSQVSSALVPDAQIIGGREYRFRIRTDVYNEADSPLYAWSSPSAVVVPLAAPAAPTLRSPNAVVPSDEQVRFAWSHRAIDGSAQSAAQWELREVGGSGTIRSTTATTATMTLASGDYEWRARTRGTYASYGPWSAWQRFTVADRPTVEFLAPDDPVLTASRLIVSVGASDPSDADILSITLELSSDAGVIERRTIGGSKPSGESWRHVFSATLENNTAYTVSATATSGIGLRSEPVEASFTTEFTPPPVPVIAADWEPEPAVASITITNPAGEPPAVGNRVERRILGEEEWQEVVADLPLDAGWSDLFVPLGGDVEYRAVAVTADGAEAASEPVVVDARSGLVVLTAPDGSDWLALEYNLSLPIEHGREVVTPTYLGDALPTAHYGLPTSESVTVEATQIRDMDQPPLPRLAGWLDGNLWYRDPEGRAWWATLSGSLSISQSHTRARQVGFTATRIQQPEGVEWPKS